MTEQRTTDLVSLMEECWKRLDPTDITAGYDTEVLADASMLLARAAHRLRELECEHAALLVGRIPTHRCKVCGALWILWPPDPEHVVPELREGSWSVFSLHCEKCCDNAPMGEQIEPLPRISS